MAPRGARPPAVLLPAPACSRRRAESHKGVYVFGSADKSHALLHRNMSIEAGARAGMIAPDETTFAYLEGRPFAPSGDGWGRAVDFWRTLPSDPGGTFDREVTLDASAVAPTVTWGTSPQDAAPITDRVPDPAAAADSVRRAVVPAWWCRAPAS